MTAPVWAEGDGVAPRANRAPGAPHARPGRPHSAPWRDAAARFEHLAALLNEAAQACQELARTPLADPDVPRLMDGAPDRTPRDSEAELLTVRDVAEMLQISPRTVRRWREDGRLPRAIVIGGVTRWSRDDIVRFLEDLRA